MKKQFLLLSGCFLMGGIVGCASSADKVGASYVSPLQYQNYTCSQLGQEAQRISVRVGQVSGAQNQKASDDAVATGVAIVLFWPAAFLISGNDHNSAELARLKGEFEAVEKASIQKNCGLQFRQEAVPVKSQPKVDRRES